MGPVSRRPRVLLVSHTYLHGGYEGKLQALADQVTLRLCLPEHFFNDYGSPMAAPRGERYELALYPPWFPIKKRSSTRWVLASLDLGMRRFQPDIVHIENEIHSFVVFQALAQRRLFAPHAKIVVFFWNNLPLAGRKALPLRVLTALARPRIALFFAGNQAGRELLLREGVSPKRVIVLPAFGIDRAWVRTLSPEQRAQRRRAYGIGEEEVVLLYVGRFVPEKGIDDLLAALRFLAHEGPPVRLLCVGDGPMKPLLLASAPLAQVYSPGGREAVQPFYEAADLLVLPSRTTPNWAEQFGRVLVEAMAVGVPAIGSSSGAIPEVIGDPALIFPERDPAALAQLIDRLRRDPARRLSAGRAGQERVVRQYTNEVIAARTVEAYRALLNGDLS
ncbi:MAG: glycosyltransferase family 4 protein [Chloroflexota bacterium]|nr:glycosyltransferase family 4 protein [Dehalococcoidia bacterium]MDW8252645.1 glycosyltransferase family 4 protein [Chloroflexota bacterium]